LLEEIECFRDELENLRTENERVSAKMNKEISIRKIQAFVRNRSIQNSRKTLQQDLDNLTSIFQKSIEKNNVLEEEVERLGQELQRSEELAARIGGEIERQRSIFKIQNFMRNKHQQTNLQKMVKKLNENLVELQCRISEQELKFQQVNQEQLAKVEELK
jgi:hypothetical protein